MSETKTEKKISQYQRYKATFTKYYNCECGTQYNLNSKHNHLRSIKHKHYMELKQRDDEIVQQKKIVEELTKQINNIKELTKKHVK